MTPQHIIAEARSWLGVPFAHQGRSRVGGVDCAGLVICVCRAVGALPEEFDVQGYSRQPDGSMRAACDRYLEPAAPELGGVVIMRFDGEPQHMGVIGNYRHGGLSIVHALQRNARVVEHRMDATWSRRVVATYRLPGLDGVT